MEKTKIKAIELCYSAAGEIRLGFFFIQDYLIFLKTFYDTLCLPENFNFTKQIELRIYQGRLGKCIFKRTKNNCRTVKELIQTTAGISGYNVFSIVILYDENNIEKLGKILNETIYLNNMNIYYVRYSTRSVIIGSSFKIIKSYLLIKKEIIYDEVY